LVSQDLAPTTSATSTIPTLGSSPQQRGQMTRQQAKKAAKMKQHEELEALRLIKAQRIENKKN
jgi:hypothetical protein